ncbi:unnamed protein product [Cercopithifilaria johnstoni]|uniref:Uncharacterized protein n=1 Tax=Cercopithifilaria johnstoni TaxID=2874296 RepID=A0A8J2M6Z4_9BILA|nr:unnamed protein product [Cercopithifilaria johnstoni]
MIHTPDVIVAVVRGGRCLTNGYFIVVVNYIDGMVDWLIGMDWISERRMVVKRRGENGQKGSLKGEG